MFWNLILGNYLDLVQQYRHFLNEFGLWTYKASNFSVYNLSKFVKDTHQILKGWEPPPSSSWAEVEEIGWDEFCCSCPWVKVGGSCLGVSLKNNVSTSNKCRFLPSSSFCSKELQLPSYQLLKPVYVGVFQICTLEIWLIKMVQLFVLDLLWYIKAFAV